MENETTMINEEKELIKAMRQSKDRNERRRLQRKIKKIHTDEKQTYDKLFLDAKDKTKNIDSSAFYEIGLLDDTKQTEEEYIRDIFNLDVYHLFASLEHDKAFC